ncbi:NADPH dehydrogenase NamA [Anaerobacillus alkalilacustris]|uniref:NADPH dehydrogenase NamA n=1 Tax=Anaerobacillus alkalilacustris TaxID=393763 RepID=A0A1S2LX77_9BACI|nr:NADPH dehydrogenase NamA [Anaerobacillus alkalilacustris]OIJ16914.1 NADPH dehydrogenase NamA [Anaerobacillus alkalilacustris]
MASLLFSPYKLKNITLKNRLVMAPMCMYMAYNKQGFVTDWHITHYGSRAIGQVGLIIIEATAVTPQGRISEQDLGIWDDAHIEGLKRLVDHVHELGGKIGIQLAHAGRKAELEGPILAPSPIAYNDEMKKPEEMTEKQITETINAFKKGAERAKEAGFDVIEIHAAHGYLINEFLSPLTNKREDFFGGNEEKRYELLKQVLCEVKSVWSGPLLVRVSANEYAEEGNNFDVFINYARKMKEQGVDLIDCSSGAVVPALLDVYPGYQVPYAERIRKSANISTGAVGLITSGNQAEEILKNERADLIFIARPLLRDPYLPRTFAKELDITIDTPKPYERGW